MQGGGGLNPSRSAHYVRKQGVWERKCFSILVNEKGCCEHRKNNIIFIKLYSELFRHVLTLTTCYRLVVINIEMLFIFNSENNLYVHLEK